MRKISRSMIIFLSALYVCCEAHGALGEPHEITFKSELDDSEQCYMEILPSDLDKDKKYDLVIGLHGHGSDRKQFAFDKRPECASFREFAAKHDMIAVTPDYRAKTSWMGPSAEADLVQIIKEIKAKYKINKVFLVGGSMGATSALTFATLHPDMIDGITSMNGHANHVEYKNFQDAISRSFGGTKEEKPEEYKKRSAEFYPENLTMSIAFTVGGKDSIVPPGSVIRLAEELRKRNGKVMVINRPKGGHSTNFEDGMTAMEFMFTGMVKKPAPISVAGAVVSETASSANSQPQAGKGGIFFVEIQPAENDAKGKVELGLKFYVEKPGKIKAFCFYQAISEKGPHVFKLWDSDGKLLFTVNAGAFDKSGWVNVPLAEPFPVSASTEYTVSYTSNTGYPATPEVFSSPVKKDGIMAIAGLYSFSDLGKKAPDKTYKRMNYFIDVVFFAETEIAK
ncbi:MAG: hypothetical protein A2017_03640 [Lentisphaerae bacterium GWF2_44_16]|nr:MAG: hypothetical protein A2017_03640 [Lentisphaerae bacterium GWF2_44_16]